MCVIIAKKQDNFNIPTKEYLLKAWSHNRDGAGYAFTTNEGISIVRKGFMHFEDFYKDFTELNKKYNFSDKNLVIHFRIGTHGRY